MGLIEDSWEILESLATVRRWFPSPESFRWPPSRFLAEILAVWGREGEREREREREREAGRQGGEAGGGGIPRTAINLKGGIKWKLILTF